MTQQERYWTRRALEKLLAEVICDYSGFANLDAGVDRAAARMKKYGRKQNKPVIDAPRLTLAAE